MKRFFTFLFAMALALSAFSQSQRFVIWEQFTNTSCAPCASRNPTIDALMNANPDKVVLLSYHVWWPGANDPMYLANSTQNRARTNYYGVNAVPDTALDGDVSGDGEGQSQIDSRYATPSPFDVDLAYYLDAGNNLNIHLQITATQAVSGNLVAHIVAIEKYIDYGSPPGNNGESVFHNTVRHMLPNENGTALPASFNVGDTYEVNVSWTADNFINLDELAVVALIQDASTKDIQQGIFAEEAAPRPTATFNPAAGAVDIEVDNNIVITLSETVRNLDNSAITNANVANLITLKEDDASGAAISFNASINAEKTQITISPITHWDYAQTIYVAIQDAENQVGAPLVPANSTFTTIGNPPLASFVPTNGAINVYRDAHVIITFDKAVYMMGGGEVTNANVASVISLKNQSSTGSNLSFTASINATKDEITVVPDQLFNYEQHVYCAVDDLQGANGVPMSQFHTEFTVHSTPPLITIDPADGSTNVLVDRNLTLSFSMGIRHLDNSSITNNNVADLITFKKDNANGDDAPFAATINGSRNLITVMPTADMDGEQTYYLGMEANLVEGGNNVPNMPTFSTFVTETLSPPTVTLYPSNGSSSVDSDVTLSITFSEAVRLVGGNEITDSNVDSYITFKKDDENGNDVSFDATINTEKTVISISPSSNLDYEQSYYFAIGSSFENSKSIANNAASSTFTVSYGPPELTFDPANGTTSVALDKVVTITFSKPIRLLDNSEITNSNVAALLTFKKDDASGEDVSFTATINDAKTQIAITHANFFANNQDYYVAIGASVESRNDIAISAASSTFRAYMTPPSVTFNPEHNETGVSKDANVTLTFSQAVRMPDNSEMTANDIAALITFKKTDSNGDDVAFTASVNDDKTIVTLDPVNGFDSNQTYYLYIGAVVENSYDVRNAAASAKFTTQTIAAPTVIFDPSQGTANVDKYKNVSITFSEAIRLINDNELTNSDIAALITFKEDNASGADVSFTASINAEKTVITLNSERNFKSQQTYYVAISAGVENSYNVAISAASTTFGSEFIQAPAVTFDPAHGATGVNYKNQITLSFSQTMRFKSDASEITEARLSEILTLKKDNQSGDDVPYSAILNGAKTVITITTDDYFASRQTYYVAVAEVLENQYYMTLSAASATFISEERPEPVVTILPSDGTNNVSVNSQVYIQFSVPVRLPNDAEISDPSSLITLKKDNANGEDVNFTASINNDKTEITISTSNRLVGQQHYYVAFAGNAVESYKDVANAAANVSFKTASAAGIEDMVNEASCLIYPNPAREQVYVKFNLLKSDLVRLLIYDAAGKIVSSYDAGKLSTGNHVLPIDSSNLGSGMYFLDIQIGTEKLSKRITIK